LPPLFVLARALRGRAGPGVGLDRSNRGQGATRNAAWPGKLIISAAVDASPSSSMPACHRAPGVLLRNGCLQAECKRLVVLRPQGRSRSRTTRSALLMWRCASFGLSPDPGPQPDVSDARCRKRSWNGKPARPNGGRSVWPRRTAQDCPAGPPPVQRARPASSIAGGWAWRNTAAQRRQTWRGRSGAAGRAGAAGVRTPRRVPEHGSRGSTNDAGTRASRLVAHWGMLRAKASGMRSARSTCWTGALATWPNIWAVVDLLECFAAQGGRLPGCPIEQTTEAWNLAGAVVNGGADPQRLLAPGPRVTNATPGLAGRRA